MNQQRFVLDKAQLIISLQLKGWSLFSKTKSTSIIWRGSKSFSRWILSMVCHVLFGVLESRSPPDGARPPADAPATPLIPGLAALSPSTNFLAYPCSTTRGAVMLVDTSPPPTPVPAAAGAAALPTAAPAPGRKHMIVAHENPVVALCFNQQGNMLATASAKVSDGFFTLFCEHLSRLMQGTCIRVWSVPEGDQIAEFRRSSGKRAHIYSL